MRVPQWLWNPSSWSCVQDPREGLEWWALRMTVLCWGRKRPKEERGLGALSPLRCVHD